MERERAPGRPIRLAVPTAALAALALLGTACGSQGGATVPPATSTLSATPAATPTPDPAALLARLTDLTAYEAEPVPTMAVHGRRDAGNGIVVSDVTFPSAGGGEVSAWLVTPAGKGPFAGLVYLHGSETDRDDLLDEATAMAHGGAVSLVLDAPFARPGADRSALLLQWDRPEVEVQVTAQAVMDVRRALDILAARPDVDPGRLGFVGHSWGANIGVDVAALDGRLRATLLICPRPSWTGLLRSGAVYWARSAAQAVGPVAWERYLDAMAPFDALPFVQRIAGPGLYVQYGTADEVIPEQVSQQLVRALGGRGRVSYYPANHALNAAATADRVAWLVARLGLRPIPAAAVAEVGLPDE
jgi:dienelactone hydrolase